MTGASQTSGFRSLERNREVGGVENSPHRYGVGLDVQYGEKEHEFAPLEEEFCKETARRLGLKLVRELSKAHDHLQPLDWEAG